MKQHALIGVMVIGTLCGWSLPAFAQTSTPGAAAKLELTVMTTVAPRCGWSSSGAPATNVALGSLDNSGQKDVPFMIDCNTPFVFSATSLGQTLSHEAPIEDLPAIFRQSVGYQVGVRIGVRRPNGQAGVINALCDATNLIGGGSCPFAAGSPQQDSFTGESIATAADTALPPSLLRISWTGQSADQQIRVAGTYSDVLTVSVQAKS